MYASVNLGMFTGRVPVASNPPKITSTPAVMFGPNAASGVNASVGPFLCFHILLPLHLQLGVLAHRMV